MKEACVVCFNSQSIYRKSSKVNVFSVSCWPQNLIQLVFQLWPFLQGVKQTLLGEKHEGGDVQEEPTKAMMGQSEVFGSIQRNPFLIWSLYLCSLKSRMFFPRKLRWRRGCVEPQKDVYISTCAYKAVVAVLTFTWPAKSLLSLSMSFWFCCFAWNLCVRHTRLKLTGHNTRQCKEWNLSNKNLDCVSLGRKTEC